MSFGNFVEISQPNIYLSLYRGFLEVSNKDKLLSRIPLDDILGLVITSFGCSHSSNLLVSLADRGIPVSICGSNFMPKALIFPVVGNIRQKVRIQSQAEAGKALKKNLWKQIIQLKLKNQALVLKENQLNYKFLLDMSKRVKSGDSENLEAYGARRYWITLFSETFRRDQKEEGINTLLNYAYAIIRSCVARAVISTGLHPSLGIHHENTYNPMCLVDDLMEPFRPIGDYVVKQLFDKNILTIDKEVKTILSKVAVVDIIGEIGVSPLFQVISRFINSFALVLAGQKKTLDTAWKIEWSYLNVSNIKSLSA